MKFCHDIVVTIGDTNVTGNVYFAQFFRWQGSVRELWAHCHCEDFADLLKSGFVLITRSADCVYHHDLYLYDKVRIELSTFEVQRVSSRLRFQFFRCKDNVLIAEGTQHIVCANASHQISPFPQQMLETCKDFQQEGSSSRNAND